MGRISLWRKRAKTQTTSWGNYTTISGVDYISKANNAHVLYVATLDLSDGSELISVEIATNFVRHYSSGSNPAVATCYLYTSDPIVGNPLSPPSNFIAYDRHEITVPYYGIFQRFNFNNLSINNGNPLFFWFELENNSSFVNEMYSSPTGNGITQTPYITGQFKSAPKNLTVSPKTVSTGDKVNVTVSNSSGQSKTVLFKYGDKILKQVTFTTESTSVECGKDWFDKAGATLLKQISVGVTVQNTILADNITVNAGANMRPTVGKPTIEIVQADAAKESFPDTFIANISKAKVTASVTLNTSTPISKVELSYPGGMTVGMTPTADGNYEATTAAPLTTNTAFTVTAYDQRGLSGSNSIVLNGVVPYSPPSVSVDAENTFRCTSDGAKEPGGDHYQINVKATVYTDLTGNTIKKLECGIKDEGVWNDLEPSVSSIFSGTTNPKKPYIIVIRISDLLSGDVLKEYTLDGLARNFVLTRSQDGTYFGIGTTPSRDSGPSSIELPKDGQFLVGGFDPTASIMPNDDTQDGSSFNKDFLAVNVDDRLSPENQRAFFHKPGSAADWKNYPPIMATQDWYGMREVLWLDSRRQLVRITEFNVPGRIWINYHLFTSWTGWYKIEPQFANT